MKPVRSEILFLPFTFGLILIWFGLSPAYEVSPIHDGATIAGKALFKGKIPEPKKLLITKNKEVCGTGYVERKEIDATKEGALRDVVVFLERVEKGKAWETPSEGFVLDQKKCAFLPNLQVIPKGAKLTVLNSDRVLHNIHTYELIGKAKRTMFNIAQPKFKPRITRVIRTRRGSPVRIECDAHDWMLGWIYVVDNPYYAIVGKDGSFTIQDIPPGTYKLKAWHPFLGMKEKKVSLSAKGKVELSFEFLE